jgi:hypothetical protein
MYQVNNTLMINSIKHYTLLLLLLSLFSCDKDDDEVTDSYHLSGSTLFLIDVTPQSINNKVKIGWTQSNVTSFSEYKLYRHETSGIDEDNGTLIHVSTNVNDTTFTDSISHNSNFYYRLLVKNLNDQFSGSNVINVKTDAPENDPLITLSSLKTGYISKNEVLWFHFNAEANELYTIAWYDEWWDEYSAGSIFVTAYKENKTDMYFPRQRLIQMNGSPVSIIANASEKIYLKVEGYDDRIEGTFGIKVDHVNKAEAIEIPIDNSAQAVVAAGETKFYYANINKNSNYTISMVADQFTGAYGDNVHVSVSAFGEVSGQPYFENEEPNVIEFHGHAKELNVTALENEKLFFSITGAYWWTPRTVDITISQ